MFATRANSTVRTRHLKDSGVPALAGGMASGSRTMRVNIKGERGRRKAGVERSATRPDQRFPTGGRVRPANTPSPAGTRSVARLQGRTLPPVHGGGVNERFAMRANCFHGARGSRIWRLVASGVSARRRRDAGRQTAANIPHRRHLVVPSHRGFAGCRRSTGRAGRAGLPDRPRRMAWTNALLKAGSARCWTVVKASTGRAIPAKGPPGLV